MREKAINKVRTVFGISLLLLLLSSSVAYFSLKRLLDSDSWVQHTYEVINQLDAVVSAMKDAETGYRGYLLTNREEFLEPYNQSMVDVGRAFSEAQRLTLDNDAQQRDFPKLKALIDDKFESCAKMIQLRRNKTEVTEADLLQGKTQMDQLRVLVRNMVVREQQLMSVRTSKAKVFASITPMVVVLAALLGIGLSVWFYFGLLRDIRRREQMSDELRQLNDSTQKSIEEISEVAKKIADGDYTARIPSDRANRGRASNGD